MLQVFVFPQLTKVCLKLYIIGMFLSPALIAEYGYFGIIRIGLQNICYIRNKAYTGACLAFDATSFWVKTSCSLCNDVGGGFSRTIHIEDFGSVFLTGRSCSGGSINVLSVVAVSSGR